MSGLLTGRVAKKKSNRSRRQVLRMMAIMQDGSKEEVPKEFLETGRTGRRNAMPDILNAPDAHATTADLPARLQELATSGITNAPDVEDSTSDLPARLQELATSDPKNPQPGPSSQTGSSSDKDGAQKSSGS